MPSLWIDGKTYEVEAGKNLLQVCLSLGLDLPYFCWHPALGSVGACRQCAVKQYRDENDSVGRLVMACMTPVTDGMRITLQDEGSVEFRAMLIEALMTNHPHDCPVCDEGGECHLQDMTVMTGHNYRDFRFKKRTFNNQYLGPFINHEMNRCITCYRCVRFYRDYADGPDLNAFASKNHVYFGRDCDGALESEFSGNLVEVCPTGVFTDKTLKEHYTRKWDLTTAPSVCHHCGLGCNTLAGERYGSIRRIINRYNGAVNGYFLCDRGRFGYDFVNAGTRIREPLASSGETKTQVPVSVEKIQQLVSEMNAGKDKILGIGSPRASLEANYALMKLAGPEHFLDGMAPKESSLVRLALSILRNGSARSVSLQEAGQADAVFILGEDVTHTAPMLALSLRQAARQVCVQKAAKANIPEWHDAAVRELAQEERSPFYIAATGATRLDDVATKKMCVPLDGIARLGLAVAHAIDPSAPAVDGLADSDKQLAGEIAAALMNARHPLVVSGTSSGCSSVLKAAAQITIALARTREKVGISLIVPECNSLGIAMLANGTLENLDERIKSRRYETLVVLENDLYRRLPSAQVDALLESVKRVIVIDHTTSPTSQKAHLVLPAGTFAEADGTLVNNEGRAQRFFQIFVPQGEIQESWRWIRDICPESRGSRKTAWQDLSDIIEALCQDVPALAKIQEAAPSSDFRIKGLRVARQPHRYSGRTAMVAHKTIHEPKPPEDPDSPFSFSMEGYRGIPPAPLIPRFWSPGWNSVQSLNKFQQEVGGELTGGDPGVRLIDPDGSDSPGYFEDVPAVSTCSGDQVQLIPLWRIFGSEEFSVLSEAVQQKIPGMSVIMNPKDAEKANLKTGSMAVIESGDMKLQLPVSLCESQAAGTVAIPAGYRGAAWIDLPAIGRIRQGNET